MLLFLQCLWAGRSLTSFEMFLFCFGHWSLKESITVLAQVSRQHKSLQTSNWINLGFRSSWELVVFLYRNLVTSFMLVDPAEAPLKLLGLGCGRVNVQTGTWPLLLSAGIVPPKHWLALAAGLQAAPVLCCWVLVVRAALQYLIPYYCLSPHRLKGRQC